MVCLFHASARRQRSILRQVRFVPLHHSNTGVEHLKRHSHGVALAVRADGKRGGEGGREEDQAQWLAVLPRWHAYVRTSPPCRDGTRGALPSDVCRIPRVRKLHACTRRVRDVYTEQGPHSTAMQAHHRKLFLPFCLVEVHVHVPIYSTCISTTRTCIIYY